MLRSMSSHTITLSLAALLGGYAIGRWFSPAAPTIIGQLPDWVM